MGWDGMGCVSSDICVSGFCRGERELRCEKGREGKRREERGGVVEWGVGIRRWRGGVIDCVWEERGGTWGLVLKEKTDGGCSLQ